MLTTAQNELLQQYLSMPLPAYVELREVSTELEDVTLERDNLKNEVENLNDEAKDLQQDKEREIERGLELRDALADALAWIADSNKSTPCEFANKNKEFLRLYRIL